MKFTEFMTKVRQLDNRTSQWIIKHFYTIFFELILVGVFFMIFMNTRSLIDVSATIDKHDNVQRLLMTQSVSTLIILVLVFINSFWTLYIFSSLLRIRSLLRNIDFNLSRRRSDHRNNKDN